ncbi:MAG: ABC transporter ATP-binding protein, partial [Chloroflexi bacterium]|nr:ABC transporter ATP-binding protein [Chloroflexota bacterium]
ARVVSSHQMDMIESICERVVVIQHGRIIAQERVDRLLALFATRSFRFHTEQPLPPGAAECLRQRFPTAQWQDDGTPANVAITFECGEQLYEAMDIFRTNGCILRSVEHETPDLEAVFLRLTRSGGETQ